MADVAKQQLFESLVTDHTYEVAWRACRRLADCREDAEDLLQESLVHAFTRLYQLRDRSRFRGWLLAIVRTRHLARLRRDKSRPQATRELPQLAAGGENPLDETIAAALARLPQPQRELLSLFYLDGLSLSETGQALGIRPQIVRQRLYRARRALRRCLDFTPADRGHPAPRGGDCRETP